MGSARRVVCVVGGEGGAPPEAVARPTGGHRLGGVQQMLSMGYMAPNAHIILCHRDTQALRAAAASLKELLETRGLGPVELRALGEDVVSELAKVIWEELRAAGGPGQCAIDVTGASALEAAVAVMAGQVLGVRVYCYQDPSPGLVCLPPLPMRVEEGRWLSNYRLWRALELSEEVVVRRVPGGVEGLVEVRSGREGFHLRLSPAGRLLAQAMAPVMEQARARMVPHRFAPAPPQLGPWDYGQLRGQVHEVLERIASELEFIGRCEVVGWAKGKVEVPGGWVEGGQLMGAVKVEGHQVIFRVEPLPSEALGAAVHLTEWVMARGRA